MTYWCGYEQRPGRERPTAETGARGAGSGKNIRVELSAAVRFVACIKQLPFLDEYVSDGGHIVYPQSGIARHLSSLIYSFYDNVAPILDGRVEFYIKVSNRLQACTVSLLIQC